MLGLVSIFFALLAMLARADDQTEEFVPETYEFKAETSKLMDIIINSLYSNNEIFLRELLSNAADALEKARFLSLTYPGILGDTPQLDVHVWFNKDLGEIYIQDTGIGMDKEELITNLGTIAESGTRRFLENLVNSTNPTDSGNLIGQFGVGFFSAFLVADRVDFDTVRTPRAEGQPLGEPLRWSSSSVGGFTIMPSPLGPEELGRGSRVTLHVKSTATKYLSEDKLKSLIADYSGFLPFNIYLQCTKTEEVPVEDHEEVSPDNEEPEVGQNETEEDENLEFEDVDDENAQETESEKTKTKKVEVKEWVHVNDNVVLWVRDPSEIEKDEYIKFFQTGIIGRKTENIPAGWVHFRGEGDIEFTTLIYIPKVAPFVFLNGFNAGTDSLLRLYISRVFVTDELAEVLPRYLAFLTGVIDSSSININLSREMIQGTRALKVIGRRITSKILDKLNDMQEIDKEEWSTYQTALKEWKELSEEERTERNMTKPEEPALLWDEFWSGYGDWMKSGVITDEKNREKILRMARWPTSYTIKDNRDAVEDIKDNKFGIVSKKTVATFSTFDEYIERAHEKQDSIYYLGGQTLTEIENSPLLEAARDRGIEVIYCINPVDTFALNAAKEYKDYKLVDLMASNVTLPDFTKMDEDENEEEKNEEDDVLDKMSPEELSNLVCFFFRITMIQSLEDVRPSTRLTSSPALIVSGRGAPTAAEERILESQATSESRFYIRGKRVMEINMEHPIIRGLARALVKLNPELSPGSVPYSNKELRNAATLIYQTACIQSGYTVDAMGDYAKLLFQVLDNSVERGWLEPTEKQIQDALEYHGKFKKTEEPAPESEEPVAEETEDAEDETAEAVIEETEQIPVEEDL